MNNLFPYPRFVLKSSQAALCIAAFFLAAASNVLAQTPTPPAKSEATLRERLKQEALKARSKDAKQPESPSLEAAMAKALKQNAEILFAEAKVREAEAELNRVQQQVLGKIATTTAELNNAEVIFKETAKQLDKLNSLRKSGGVIVSELEIGAAEVAVAKYRGEVTRKQAELDVLIGKLPITSGQVVRSGSTANAPILRTYFLSRQGQSAETLVNLLSHIYQPSPMLRVTSVDTGQIIVYAPVPIQEDIAKFIDAKGWAPEPRSPDPLRFKNSKGFFKTMRARVKMIFAGSEPVALNDVLGFVLAQVKKITKESSLNIMLSRGIENGKMPPINLPEPIAFAAALQLIEDMTEVRFIVRDYGIVGVPANDIPRGAILFDDVVEQMPPESPAGKKTNSK